MWKDKVQNKVIEMLNDIYEQCLWMLVGGEGIRE
jgi:hypothetical protein